MSGSGPASSAKIHHAPQGKLPALVLGALGIVFGDIGTSPLYTLKECLAGEHGAGTSHDAVLGVLSLIFWSLTMVVTVKYLSFVMRADNNGEGGILALLALVPESARKARPGRVSAMAVLVLIGAALLYGDGIITPSISVLSAVEGLELVTDKLKPAVLPITVAILVGLFFIQSKGTGLVGKLFGPVMLLWFATLGVLGVMHIRSYPAVLSALSPLHAVRFFTTPHGWKAFPVLGGVVLAVTGGEALYADMGHFGARPIRIGWWFMAMPALILNYLGQGAMLLQNPKAIANPFFSMVPPGAATIALMVLATFATVIASQALISGAFSLTHQAVQLGFFPRVSIRHTSREAEGQIYVPVVNWGLMIACVILVLSFKESTRLAAAYGIAVTGTMAITSIVYFVVVRETWGWSLAKALPLLVLFLAFDLPFLGANALKFLDGGYVPVLVGGLFLTMMVVWRRGRSLLAEYILERSPPMDEFLSDLPKKLHGRIPGAGIFLTANASRVPATLYHHAARIMVLPQVVVLMTVNVEHVPTVSQEKRLEFMDLGNGFYRLFMHVGFMERPNVASAVLMFIEREELGVKHEECTYYVGRETFLATSRGKMGAFSEGIFAFLSRNAEQAITYFSIPPEQVVELGTQIDL